uniref:Uncharacterized protein n=1 Tax=Ciona savignyi TaxID=51511 RepID=H2YUE2_CIOSA
MDRLNLGKLGSSYFISLCKIDPGAWAVFVYIVALGMDVGISGFDFWLGRGTVSAIAINGGTNSTTLNYDQLNLNSASSLTTWSALNVLRAVLVVIGWVLLALNPTTDATSSQLFSSKEGE